MLPRLNKRRVIIIGVVTLMLLLLFIKACSNDRSNSRDITAQINANNQAIEQFSEAVINATATVDDRVADERAIEQAVRHAQKEIGNAQTPDDIRTAILVSLCQRPSHYSDPACEMFYDDS